MLETFFSGFKWLSIKALALGGLESFLYGAYLSGSFVLIHNFFQRRHQKEVQVSHASKKAACNSEIRMCCELQRSQL